MLILGDSGLNLALSVHSLDDVLAVTAEKIVDGLYANPYRPSRFVFVKVLERKIRCVRFLDNAFDHPVNGCVMAAFEIRNLHRHQVWMPGCKLRRPDLMVGARGVTSLPYISDVKRMRNNTRANLFSKQTVQQVFI